MKISRVMSTQHPDNVNTPFFASGKVIHGDEEVKEAFYAYSHLGCKEQLWDCEGKEVDNFVVKKLFTNYEQFFRKQRLGEDVFLTLRVPNPSVERNEAKILLETLESIPRSFDLAKIFYNEELPPIFEVTVPMTANHQELVRISQYYKRFIIERQHQQLADTTIAKWIGGFGPQELRVTPLFETKESILNADRITEEYMMQDGIKSMQRVWLARSDPALNYGNISAMMLSKVALQRLHLLAERTSVDIYPILGCGSAPFRGNLKPTNARSMLRGYPSVHTYTVQSAFKYDYPERVVAKAIDQINDTPTGRPIVVDEERCERIIEKVSSEYAKQVKLVAPIVNEFKIPQRRRRNLHVGLFGYSRASAGVRLPRAIPFCASLYSLGLPPELLGMNALTQEDIDYIRSISPGFDEDMRDALRFLNKENLALFPPELQQRLLPVLDMFEFEIDQEHKDATTLIAEDFRNGKQVEEHILRAGYVRGFLG